MQQCFVSMLFATMLTTSTAYAAPLGIMVPAYFYPSPHGYWTALDWAAARVPLIAILNPDSGPGGSKDTTYVQELSKLHEAGGKIIGYVHTSYGMRSLEEVKNDINLYLSRYAVDGLFIDEMTNDQNTNHIDYYAVIYEYIKTRGTNYIVVGNLGSNTEEDYITKPTADSFMIFENDGTNYASFTPSSWVTKYPAKQFVQLPYDVTDPTIMSNDVRLAVTRNTGWIYITSNPYNTLPFYWTNEVNMVQSFNKGNLSVTKINHAQPAN